MKYLVQFAIAHEDFRVSEIDSILNSCGVRPEDVFDASEAQKQFNLGYSFLICNLASEDHAVEISERAILVRRVLELWGFGQSMDHTVDAVRKFPLEMVANHADASRTWSISVESCRFKITMEKRAEVRKKFNFLPMKGKVKCENSDTSLYYIEEYEADDVVIEGKQPIRTYFGREVGRSNRHLVSSRRLTNRLFLGPTSMDNELSLVMANMVQAKRGSMILDPFVGTGSILLAAAQMGAFCVGTDIDPRPLHGRNGLDVFSNFKQFDLPYPEIIRSDNSLYVGHFRTDHELYDGIVCDPPYGVRAGAKRTGSRRAVVKVVQEHQRWDHCPMVRPYEVDQVLYDLLDTSANVLKLGGRLCYLMHCKYELCTLERLPGHPCMRFVGHGVQGLSKTTCRRMVTMEKVCHYEANRREEYLAFMRKGMMATDADPRVNIPQPSAEWKNMFLHRGKHGATSRMTTCPSSES